ncbi:MAG: hypothetical protein GY807_04965 [Gammaproteobacteria bacterium]|nr:hypothetical protein [Gammaproteobacteria bacterium]
MKTDELFQLIQFAALLKDVIPILGRFLEEEAPAIVADESRNDLHRQLILPLADSDEPSRPYHDSFPEPQWRNHEDSV